MDATASLSGLRILVVGINYAPEHTGIAPYTTQACRVLAGAGAGVYVLSGLPHYPHWNVPAEYRGRIHTDELDGPVRVRRLRHHVPGKQSALTRSAYELSFGLHVLGQRLPWRPDVVIAVIPSLLGAAAAGRLAAKASAPLVLWVQDLMGAAAGQSGIAGGGRISRVTHAIEAHTIKQAAAVVVVSDAFRASVRAAGASEDRIHHVPNWVHVDAPTRDRAATRARLGWRDDEVVALHSGNMGLKQGLENVVEAARLAGTAATGLRFVLMGDGSQREALADLGAGVAGLQMLPPAAHEDFPNVLAAADILLVNERGSAVNMSLPSKLTSYFGTSRPVVAAIPSTGGTAAEIRRSGGGLLVSPDDPRALLEAIAKLATDPETRSALGKAGAAHAQAHLTAEASLSRLSEVLVDVLPRVAQAASAAPQASSALGSSNTRRCRVPR